MICIKKDTLVLDPLVSVIIPSYNRHDTIEQTIESIMNQRCDFDIELIIGDDCSTEEQLKDTLTAYQNKYPKNIILLLQETNIGLGANWATCVKNCRGKYIANCDNDDYWHNADKLQLQVNFMEQHPQYGVCHTDYQILNTDTNKIYKVKVNVNNTIYKDPSLQEIIFNGGFDGCNATMLYRKSVIDKYIRLDDYIKYQFVFQDWNTWVVLAKYTQFYCLPISTATYRRGKESLTNLLSYEALTQVMKKRELMSKYVCDLFPDDLVFDKDKYENFTNNHLLDLAYRRRDFSSARKYSQLLTYKGISSLKVKLAKNKLFFWGGNFLKKIEQRINSLLL